MNKFLFLLLFLVTFSFSQTVGLFVGEEVDESTAGSIQSDEIRFSDEFKEAGNLFGLLSFTLDVDSSLTVNGGDDSLYFTPEFKINGKWYEGDTLEWDRFNTSDITATIIQTNHTWILPSVLHDSLLVFIPDPTDTTSIWGLPTGDDFKLKCYYSGDSTAFTVDVRVGIH